MMAQELLKNECYKGKLKRGSSSSEELEEGAGAVLLQPPVNAGVEQLLKHSPG